MSTTDSVPATGLAQRARRIKAAETESYLLRTRRSQAATARAKRSLPLGVSSSFQAYEPHPIVAARAKASWLEDVDGNHYVDFNMGFGALFVGHLHPLVVAAVKRQLDEGTLFVTPSADNASSAELLQQRFGDEFLFRFTNSGTEATMDAIRLARGVTGRNRIVKVEGGYHGHHDEVMVSMKPPLDQAGPADAPLSVPSTAGLTPDILSNTLVVPYNDPEALDRVLSGGDIAAFIVEPAMENIGICLPQPGYLEAVRDITRRFGTLLIFDEVKTGITAGWAGASGHFGVQPDLICLAKSIGGGLPVGAFGGRAEYMDEITAGRVLHLGTYNGNPLVLAAVRAVLGSICTPEVTEATIAANRGMLDQVDAVIASAGLPAHTVQLGAKGCVTFATTPVRNYRDYKATDFDLAFASWLWGINRGILLPPGLDEQWLVSVQHTAADLDRNVEVFAGFVTALTR